MTGVQLGPPKVPWRRGFSGLPPPTPLSLGDRVPGSPFCSASGSGLCENPAYTSHFLGVSERIALYPRGVRWSCNCSALPVFAK